MKLHSLNLASESTMLSPTATAGVKIPPKEHGLDHMKVF